MNARTARAWLVEKLGTEAAVPKHFVAVSTATDGGRRSSASTPKNMFDFWDWVGGRYSLWSAIGLPIALRHRHGHVRGAARGRPRDGRALPHRAAREERAGRSWGCSASGTRTSSAPQTHAILPYDQYMHRFAAYFQQGDMESNGKRVDRDGPLHRGLHDGPDRLGRAGHERPARVLPAHPPGHARSSRATFLAPLETHNPLGQAPRGAARELLRADRGADERQDAGRGARRARGAEAAARRASPSSSRTRRSPATARRRRSSSRS